MKAFLTGTGEVLGGLAHAAERFEAAGQGARVRREQIDASNRRTEEVMADRREALDSVVNQIDSKVGDLDQRLKRFSALLSETFEAAEGRARDIARVLAESSTEGTKAIANQYELVRATTDEERKRTSEALNSIYEQATGETSALFRQTSEKFLEIVRQMKEMSGAMQREMETTRTELRRGILELPQETAESAAQHAPRDRRADRCARRAQPHRRAAQPRHRGAGASRRADGGERRRAHRGPPGGPLRGAPRPAPLRGARAARPSRAQRGQSAAAPPGAAGAGSAQRRLADRPARARRARGAGAARGRRPAGPARHGVARQPVGRYRAHDRP